MVTSKRILIISEAHLIRTFVLATIKKIKEETGSRFDCFITTTIDVAAKSGLYEVFENVYVNEFPKGLAKSIPKVKTMQAIYGMRKLAMQLGQYDIAHVHFYYSYYSLFMPIIRKKAKKTFLTFFGSDYYKPGRTAHLVIGKSLTVFDRVFAISNGMLAQLTERYRLEKSKTGILYFLISSFIAFDTFLKEHTNASAKQLWNFDKPTIVCGYSAAIIMRHMMVIDTLDPMSDKIAGYKVVFPMTYGWKGDERRAMVRERLDKTALDYEIVEEFMPVEKLQALRLATDIFINVPSSDQLAASMLEHLAAGSVVITGRWLPYNDLVEMGVYLIFIESPEQLGDALADAVANFEMHKEKSRINREIILKLMSWDSIKGNWYTNYNLM